MASDRVARITLRGRRWWKASAAGPAALTWLVGYLAVALSGVAFSTSYLGFGWQLTPWDVLSNDPLRSAWYLHVQPPLWNLVLGVPAWLSPWSDAITLQIVMLAVGLATVALAARLAEILGAGRRAAWIIAVAATLHPEVLKGAFEPNYELAVAALLLAVLVALAHALAPGSTVNRARRIGWLAAVLTVLVMTRSLYHPLFAAVVLAVVLWRFRSNLVRRQMLLIVLLPVIVVGGWIVKNQIMFGTPNLSSWFGMNLQRAVIPVLDRDDLESMYERGDVSDVAMVGPFGAYDLYAPYVDSCEPAHSFRSLSEPTRRTDATSPNFNYECYIPVFEQAGRDAWAVIREHPGAWWEGRMWSLRTTIAVATLPSESDSVVMRVLDDVYSVARLDYRGVLSTEGWGTPIYGSIAAPADFSVTLALAYVSIGLWGLALLAKWLRRRRLDDIDLVNLAGWFIIVFTVLVGAVAELGEQSRFRTVLDPIATVMIATAVIRLVSMRRQSQAPAPGE